MIDKKLNNIFKSLTKIGWEDYGKCFKIENGVMTYTNGRILIRLDLPMDYRNDIDDGIYNLDNSPAPQINYPKTEHFIDKKLYPFDTPIPALTAIMAIGVRYKYPKKKKIVITKNGSLFDGGDKSFAAEEPSLTAEHFNVMADLGVKEVFGSSKDKGIFCGLGEFDGLNVKVIAAGWSSVN